jgi:hypothetical protein
VPQFVAKAEAICGRLNAELVAAKSVITGIADVARIAPRRATAEHIAQVELNDLTPPVALSGSWQRIMAARQKLVEDIVKIGESAKANDQASVNALFVSSANEQRLAVTIAERDGFKACSKIG